MAAIATIAAPFRSSISLIGRSAGQTRFTAATARRLRLGRRRLGRTTTRIMPGYVDASRGRRLVDLDDRTLAVAER